jgi:hypothetical protein
VDSKWIRYFAQVLTICLLVAAAAWAQGNTAAVSGVVTNQSGAPVAQATVSVKNTANNQTASVQTDAAGKYTVAGLAAGVYEVTAAGQGLGAPPVRVTLAAGGQTSLNLSLTANFNNAGGLSLGDLGFTPEQTKGSAAEQARLDKRSHMLKMHQRLGLITTAPLIATLIAANGAGGRNSSASGRELHAALGSITAGMYFTTASFAIFAPKIPGTPVRGPIRLHRALAWIHGPGMVLTPVLGALAYEQRSNGQRVHGIARAHGPVAIVTAAAYGLAIFSVSVKF